MNLNVLRLSYGLMWCCANSQRTGENVNYRDVNLEKMVFVTFEYVAEIYDDMKKCNEWRGQSLNAFFNIYRWIVD